MVLVKAPKSVVCVALHDPLCDPEATVGDYCVAQLSELIGLLDGTEDAVLAGDVGAYEDRPAAQFVSQCLALVDVEIGDDHSQTVGVEPSHRRLTEAARAAADDRRRAFKLV